MPTQVLDTTYTEIIKNNLNVEQHLHFIKNFTVKAISNYAKQKSFFATLFRRSKNSPKYDYYGLDLFFREIQDEGAISAENILLVVELVKEIFTLELFQGERANYIAKCVSWLEKGRNLGQAIKLLNSIISTFPTSSFFGNNRK